MTTLTRPSWFKPRDCVIALRKSSLQFVSPFNGSMQSIEQLAERWVFNLSIPGAADGGARSAFFNQWAGGVNRVALYHFGRPQPHGTLRGAPTLAADTARGDTTLSLSNVIGSNLIPNGSFEVAGTGGLGAGWSRYSAGTVGTLSANRSTGVKTHGSYSQSLAASTLGSTSSDRQGITKSGISVAAFAGLAVVLSCDVLGTLNSTAHLEIAWRDSGGSVISGLSADVAFNTGYQALSVTGTCPANAVTAIVYVWQHSNTGVSPSFYVDSLQLRTGSAVADYSLPTLLAGDMVGDGTQLYQVAEDTSANDDQTMTLPIVNRCRGVVAAGTVLLWDRPTCLCLLPALEVAPTFMRGGHVDSLVLDAVEVY